MADRPPDRHMTKIVPSSPIPSREMMRPACEIKPLLGTILYPPFLSVKFIGEKSNGNVRVYRRRMTNQTDFIRVAYIHENNPRGRRQCCGRIRKCQLKAKGGLFSRSKVVSSTVDDIASAKAGTEQAIQTNTIEHTLLTIRRAFPMLFFS